MTWLNQIRLLIITLLIQLILYRRIYSLMLFQTSQQMFLKGNQ